MGWINVVEPITGVTLTVQEDSPQAKLWAKSAESDVEEAAEAERLAAEKAEAEKAAAEKAPRASRAAKSDK